MSDTHRDLIRQAKPIVWVAVLRHQAREIGTYGSAGAAALALAHACGKPADNVTPPPVPVAG